MQPRRIPTLAALLTIAACSPKTDAPAVNASDASATTASDSHWVSLFDGVSITEWRGFKQEGVPAGWTVVDSAITKTGDAPDLISKKQYRNFELELEWRLKQGGNSGIMYRVTEDADETYETGPEYQVLDDALHADGKNRLTSAGAAYGLYAQPEGLLKPVGEWNTAKIVVNGNHVEHWLNGTKGVEYELGSPDWTAKVEASKFKQWPGYGKAPQGHIALQNHGDWVAYRNIRIRELP
ncbi:MAG TPA: DUF1080 domain-containing protein [Gemmatimonadales bacterium]|nr:DUF1080 domain-containing protein [Gemmatimonadales bacterium]